MSLSFWSDLFIEAGAEILKKSLWFFGQNDEVKKSFWNKLTFRLVSICGLMKYSHIDEIENSDLIFMREEKNFCDNYVQQLQ